MSKHGEAVAIEFGAAARPISEQLAAVEGAEWSETETAKYQRLADAVTLLAVHGVLTDTCRAVTRQRLVKMIARNGMPR